MKFIFQDYGPYALMQDLKRCPTLVAMNLIEAEFRHACDSWEVEPVAAMKDRTSCPC